MQRKQFTHRFYNNESTYNEVKYGYYHDIDQFNFADEYQYYLQFHGLLADSSWGNIPFEFTNFGFNSYGEICENFLSGRPELMKDGHGKKRIESFPDTVIVNNGSTLIVEQFVIDDTKRAVINGKRQGSPLINHLKKSHINVIHDIEILQGEGIIFSNDEKIKNLHDTFTAHAKKLSKYVDAINKAIIDKNLDFEEHNDLNKMIYYWLFINDISQKFHSNINATEISKLLKKHKQVDGVIYFKNKNIFNVPSTLDPYIIIQNNSNARKKLKKFVN